MPCFVTRAPVTLSTGWDLRCTLSGLQHKQNFSLHMVVAQVLEVTARGARLRVSHLGSLELVQALAEAYSHYVFAPYVSPHPQVRPYPLLTTS